VGRDTDSDLRALARARIYFGHHSVGDNMLSGLQRIASEEGVADLRIEALGDLTELPETFLAHSRVGANGDPQSKLEDFARILRGGTLARLDLAFMKFCYVDFDPSSDAAAIYDRYCLQLEELEAGFPEVRFLHATVPLKVRRLGARSRIKLLLRRPMWEDDSNVKRHEFNELIRANFDEGRIVDIARAESTASDGSESTFARNGRRYPCMRPDLSTDGGHLNELGERRVGAEMISKLADNLC
jgi:hypothetical protein